MEKISEILSSSLLAGIIAYLINILLKNIIESRFNKDIEYLKSELAILKDNQSFRFNKLHDKRFSVFEELFKLLNQYYYDLHIFSHPAMITNAENPYMKQKTERFEKCLESKSEFLLFYANNIIYFDNTLISNIEEFKKITEEIFKINYEYFSLEVNMESYGLSRKDLFEASQNALKEFSRVESEAKQLLKEVENTLRNQLSYDIVNEN